MSSRVEGFALLGGKLRKMTCLDVKKVLFQNQNKSYALEMFTNTTQTIITANTLGQQMGSQVLISQSGACR